MEALIHAVEAYIGGWSTLCTDRMALAGVAMVFRHLPRACAEGSDVAARELMARASICASLAFTTRAKVGDMHPIAHRLGTPNCAPYGLVNALPLAPILSWCNQAALP